MKVILEQDVPRLGRKGEVVEVNDGYARNFLLPRKLARSATAGALKEVEALKRRAAEKEARAAAEAKALAKRLAGRTVTIPARAGEGGRLFGSVTNQDVADAINRAFNLNLDKRRVELKEPIKAVGTYTVTVRLYTEVTAEVTVQVVAA
ncbi:MAG: large subunit ribosomal protein [Bacillota bacterium]|jgi:large subunit ribosomal protein L9|nr:large subunit ribosomal protein [Bacillota bacterium]